MFIVTSKIPIANPKGTRITITTGTLGAKDAAESAKLRIVSAEIRIVLIESFLAIAGAAASPTAAIRPQINSKKPTSPSVAPTCALIKGILEAKSPYAMPGAAKKSAVARRVVL